VAQQNSSVHALHGVITVDYDPIQTQQQRESKNSTSYVGEFLKASNNTLKQFPPPHRELDVAIFVVE
jgi:hypothetical protein